MTGQVGKRRKLAQPLTVGECDLRSPAAGPGRHVQLLALYPHLGVDRAGALAQEREVALVDLGQDFMRHRCVDVDLGREVVVAGH